MKPFLHQGDHVLTLNWQALNVGDAVVFKTGNNYFVKRIVKIASGEVTVRGDNRALSSKIDPINKIQIVGKVIFKY